MGPETSAWFNKLVSGAGGGGGGEGGGNTKKTLHRTEAVAVRTSPIV